MKLIYSIVFGVAVHICAISQSTDLPYINFTVEDGLPSMHTYDIIQDNDGFIWIGTDAGVSQFDGYHFENMTTKNGLSNNDVFRLMEDTNGRIWFCSIQKLCYYENNLIHQIKNENPRYLKYTLNFKETTGGYWFEKSGSLYFIDHSFSIHKKSRFKFDKSDTESFSRILSSIGDTVWIYNRNMIYGLLGTQIIDSLFIPPAYQSFQIKSLGQLGQNIYFVIEKGLVEWNRQENTVSLKVKNIGPTKRIFTTQNELWIVHSFNGIIRIKFSKPKPPKVFKYFDKVICIGFLKDKEGNNWITTQGQGVFFIPANAEKIEHLSQNEGLQDNNVISVFLDDEDNIWAGYPFNHTDKIDPFGNIQSHNVIPNTFFIQHVRGMVWTRKKRDQLIVTDGGLFKNIGDQYRKVIQQVGKSVSIGSSGEILMTSSMGTFLIEEDNLDSLDHFDPRKYPENELVTTLSKERSYAALMDSKKRIWLGDVTGLKTIDSRGNVTQWASHSNIFKALVTDIQETKNGLIWVATHGEGLIVFQDSSYYQIGQYNGLTSDICTKVAADDSEIWIATNRGINHIHTFDFNTKNVGINIIGISEGLKTNEILDIEKKKDQIVIGTNQGISILNEKNIKTNEIPPKIFIKKIKINYRDTSLSKVYNLSHFQQNIQIEYVGLSFRSLKNITYYYKLEGLDQDWKTTKALNVNYTTLPSGKYSFHVKAVINGQLESETKTIDFHINKHFTDTSWFWILGFTFMAGLLFYFYYSFIIHLQRKKLRKIVDFQTAEINTRLKDLTFTNNKLETANTTLRQFAYVVSHDLKAPLRAISSLATFLEEDMKDRMQDSEKENMSLLRGRIKRMEALINGILEYSRVGQKKVKTEKVQVEKLMPELIHMAKNLTSKKIEIQYPNDLPVIETHQTSLNQVLQNLISNAIKYSDKEVISIELCHQEQSSHHLFAIKDNGPGIPKRFHDRIFHMFQTLQPRDKVESTGIGLSIVEKIVKDLGEGKIWIESEPGQGATFYFTWKK